MAAHQKMQQQANKHPLDLEYLKQKIIKQGGQPPADTDADIQASSEHAKQMGAQLQNDDQQQASPEEGQDQQAQPTQSKYTDLVGKSNTIDFDTWLDVMRSKL
jgi:hypothetical protein